MCQCHYYVSQYYVNNANLYKLDFFFWLYKYNLYKLKVYYVFGKYLEMENI